MKNKEMVHIKKLNMSFQKKLGEFFMTLYTILNDMKYIKIYVLLIILNSCFGPDNQTAENENVKTFVSEYIDTVSALNASSKELFLLYNIYPEIDFLNYASNNKFTHEEMDLLKGLNSIRNDSMKTLYGEFESKKRAHKIVLDRNLSTNYINLNNRIFGVINLSNIYYDKLSEKGCFYFAINAKPYLGRGYIVFLDHKKVVKIVSIWEGK